MRLFRMLTGLALQHNNGYTYLSDLTDVFIIEDLYKQLDDENLAIKRDLINIGSAFRGLLLRNILVS